ncbi:MAG: AlpA family phage regulatory protein [Sphingopyxis sp.]|nr:AlpA family phage regulatory protein [Sphingopyxis sp.]
MGKQLSQATMASAERFITVEDFAQVAGLSRRTIDRYRRDRPSGFPKEYDLSRGSVPRPRFKMSEVLEWMESRALW